MGREQQGGQRIKIDRKRVLIAVLIIVIIGALIARRWYGAGIVITWVAIGGYLLLGLKGFLRRVRKVKKLSTKGKIRVGVWIGMFLVAVSLWTGGKVSYLMLLVLLSVDYLLLEGENSI